MELTWWLAFLWGVFGQFIRVIVGIKKQMEKASETGKRLDDWFDIKLVIVTLLVGGIAGFVGFLFFGGADVAVITVIAIGYAGTDFIEGLLKKQGKSFGLK